MIDSIVDLISLKLPSASTAVVLTTNDMSNLENLVVPEIKSWESEAH